MPKLLAVAILALIPPCPTAVAIAAPHPFDLMADSPVTFPKEGALPSKYPPDQGDRHGIAPEPDYFLHSTPERSLAQIATIQAEMTPGHFTPPPHDWAYLQRTRRTLVEGGTLRILAVGDSIVADTMRSAWVAKLAEMYPKAQITARVYVRGGGGCQHYREDGRVQKVIVPEKPDLLLIGGISQKDIDSIRQVIHQVRNHLPDVEILLFTGTFGTADPRVPEELARFHCSGTSPYGKDLKALAAEEHCAFLEMTSPWAEYLNSTGVHPHFFYRDAVHANEFGEQILSKILMSFWSEAASPTDSPSPPGP
jgi:hypothetical protein